MPHPSESNERFLDVGAILNDFNPLTGSHLLAWGDSEDDDDTVQAELPPAYAWEDAASGYQGLEHLPSWIDYRDGSDSDDPDSARRRGAVSSSSALSALLPHIDDISPGRGGSGMPPSADLPNAYTAEAGFQEIAPHELEERLATGQFALLLDVRSRAEFEGGHIQGSVNLPLDTDLSEAVRAGSLDEYRTRPIAVVCGSGMRSGQATVRLTKVFGFGNVVNVAGGVRAWAAEGLPLQGRQQWGGAAGGSSGGCGCGGGGGSGGGCKNKQAAA